MKVSIYTIAKRNTNAANNGNYYECENTNENRQKLKKLLMPAKVTKDNKIIFPYFN